MMAAAGKKRALLIGINYSATPSAALNGCINDVRRVRDMLLANGWKEGEIIVLTDEPSGVGDKVLGGSGAGAGVWGKMRGCITRTDAIVSSAKVSSLGILRELGRLKEASWDMELDLALVYYSGHGGDVPGFFELMTGEDEEGLMPADSALGGMVRSSQFTGVLRDFWPGCKIVCFFDACNSGNELRLPWVWKGTRWEDNKEKKRYVNWSSERGVLCFAGCGKDQTSGERTRILKNEKKETGGLFTDAVLEAIEKLSYNNITGSVLIDEVTKILVRERAEQVPVLQSSICKDGAIFF